MCAGGTSSRAVRTEHDDHLAGLDREIDTGEGGNRPASATAVRSSTTVAMAHPCYGCRARASKRPLRAEPPYALPADSPARRALGTTPVSAAPTRRTLSGP